jgi:hypothetical protein
MLYRVSCVLTVNSINIYIRVLKIKEKQVMWRAFLRQSQNSPLNQTRVLDFLFLPITSVILLDANPISTFTSSLTL